jgi:hypothetical protein
VYFHSSAKAPIRKGAARLHLGQLTMAMKKAEMEEHDTAYRRLIEAAKSAESEGLYRVAVDAAIAAWEHIDGMMQYRLKYATNEFGSISAIDLVLRYAPLLFDFRSLNALEQLLESRKRIEKNASASIVEKLAAARLQMWDNHRLWARLEHCGEVRQDQLREILGGSQDHWRWLAESWARMGLVKRAPEAGSYRVTLSTRIGQVIPGKCPACGKISEAPKGMFFDKMACPECHRKVLFVLLPSRVGT